MVHGMLGDWKLWIPFILPILHKYDFIIPDQRGHGKSEMKNDISDICFELIADDIHSVVQAELKDTPFTIVAYSMGTIASLMMKKVHGWNNVVKYIHIDHSTNFSIENGTDNLIFQEWFHEFKKIMDYGYEKLTTDPGTYRKFRLSDITKDEQQMADDIIRIIAFETTMVGVKEVFPFLKWWMVRPFVRHAINMQELMANYMIFGHCYTSNQRDFSPILSTIECPATFFVACKNKLFSKESQLKSIEEHIPGARVVLFERSSHDLLAAEPIKFMRTLWHELSDVH